MTPEQITQANAELRDKPALDIVKWAIAQFGVSLSDLLRSHDELRC